MTKNDIPRIDGPWNVARRLFPVLVEGMRNPVWSPACVASVLEVLALGSEGTTRDELSDLVGDAGLIGADDPYSLVCADKWKSDDYMASLAVGLWLSARAKPAPWFVEACERARLSVTEADLADPATAGAIARWVDSETHGQVSPNVTLPRDALACVVGAIYLRDAWEDPFIDANTIIGTFHAEAGDVRCAYMRGRMSCEVIESDDVLVVSLGLSAGGRLLVAVGPEKTAPDANVSLRLFEDVAREGYAKEEVRLSMPRFECEMASVDLEDALRSAGVSTARAMELGPMVGTSPCPMALIHGARLAVDERGLEAGAYTMAAVCEAIPAPDPREVVLDRPFLFALVSQNGTPLFVGRVDTPSENTLVWRDMVDREDYAAVDWAFAMGERYTISDEGVDGWCRMTVEDDQPKGVFEITCKIYGSLTHTVFAPDYSEAYDKAEGMKRDLEEFVRLSEGDAPFDRTDWIRSFVERWQ